MVLDGIVLEDEEEQLMVRCFDDGGCKVVVWNGKQKKRAVVWFC